MSSVRYDNATLSLLSCRLVASFVWIGPNVDFARQRHSVCAYGTQKTAGFFVWAQELVGNDRPSGFFESDFSWIFARVTTITSIVIAYASIAMDAKLL